MFNIGDVVWYNTITGRRLCGIIESFFQGRDIHNSSSSILNMYIVRCIDDRYENNTIHINMLVRESQLEKAI